MSIKAKIDDYLDEFEQASSGLLSYNNRFHQTFEQGVYGCVYAKPSRRLASALTIDRELLILVSTFTEQQQRTIKFCRQHIDSSHGRLENTVAIVIHLDDDANHKLKNWGREQGLTILPVCAKQGIPRDEALEKVLYQEIFSHDPFDITGPVSDDANFFGRRTEAIDLARKLQAGQIRSCLGIRKIGKTSIINRIYGEIQSNYTSACIMIDCSRDDVWSMHAGQFLQAISECVARVQTAEVNYLNLDAYAADISVRDGRIALEREVLKLKVPLILLFDEVDYITPGSPTSLHWKQEFNPFWRNLRSVYQEAQRQRCVFSLLIGGVSTYWFTVDSIDGVENAAMAFVPEEYLSPMPTGATVAMLKRLSRVVGLQLDDESARMIADVTGNMPYWARKACSYVHRHIDLDTRPCAVGREQLARLLDEFVREDGTTLAEVGIRHLFSVYPGLWDAAVKCREGRPLEAPERTRRILRRYGVVAADGKRLSGKMVESAMTSLISERTELPQTDNGAHGATTGTAGSLGEWAEELALLGKRRNILEKRLRTIAVNFIRFDTMTSGKPADVYSRVTSAVDTNRRSQLRNLSAEEAINRFNWTDLVSLICREWPLFSKLFGDKGSFKSNAEIINDRFDAHAKDADAADFALYRRALSALERRIEKYQ